VVNFTSLPLYPWRKSPWYPMVKRLAGPQSQSGQHAKEKIPDPTRTRTRTPWSSSPIASHYTDRAIWAKTERGIRKKIFGIPSDEGTSHLSADPDSVTLQQLKENFEETTNEVSKL
jgi:hypothetical protein